MTKLLCSPLHEILFPNDCHDYKKEVKWAYFRKVCRRRSRPVEDVRRILTGRQEQLKRGERKNISSFGKEQKGGEGRIEKHAFGWLTQFACCREVGRRIARGECRAVCRAIKTEHTKCRHPSHALRSDGRGQYWGGGPTLPEPSGEVLLAELTLSAGEHTSWEIT